MRANQDYAILLYLLQSSSLSYKYGEKNKTKAVMELRQRIINTKTSLPSSGRQKLIEPSHPEFVTDKQADSCEAGSQSRDFLPSLLSIKLTECR